MYTRTSGELFEGHGLLAVEHVLQEALRAAQVAALERRGHLAHVLKVHAQRRGARARGLARVVPGQDGLGVVNGEAGHRGRKKEKRQKNGATGRGMRVECGHPAGHAGGVVDSASRFSSSLAGNDRLCVL